MAEGAGRLDRRTVIDAARRAGDIGRTAALVACALNDYADGRGILRASGDLAYLLVAVPIGGSRNSSTRGPSYRLRSALPCRRVAGIEAAGEDRELRGLTSEISTGNASLGPLARPSGSPGRGWAPGGENR